MDWTHKIVVKDGRLLAECESEGGRHVVGLAELYRYGLPTGGAMVRHTVKVNFADFVPCEHTEYLAHFGAPSTEGPVCAHQVYEVGSNGQRFLVPALALMRAMFKPSIKLLGEMFAPNALERTCRLCQSGDTVQVIVDTKWAKQAAQASRSNCEVPLGWMMTHPSARNMADSVHRHAMSGRLAIDLPAGHAELVLTGVQGATSTAVTKVKILTIFPGETPDVPGASWSSSLDFVNREWAKDKNIRNPLRLDMPPSIPERPYVTDEEWALISPVLNGQRKNASPFQHCQRKLFEGILQKLSSGKSWKKSTYTVGDWRNAANAYRRWVQRGTFEQALNVLRGMR